MILLAWHRARNIALAIVAALIAAGVAVAISARSAHAQNAPRTPSVTYLYLRTNGDTIGVETITKRSSGIDGALSMKGQPRVEWSQAGNGKDVGPLSLKVFAPGAAADATPLQSGTIEVRGDSAYIDLGSATQRAKQAVATKAGAMALVNASVLHAALLSTIAHNRNTSTIQIFLSSGGQTLPATVTQAGDTTVFKLATSEMRILSAPDGLPSAIALPGQGAQVVRSSSPVTLSATPVKHNYDAPAGAPYTAEQVRIPTGRGYELAATFTRPIRQGLVPVVITISGSGPQERNSELSVVPGYAIFREIADTLGRRGVAVLRWDDRGVGESGGRESAAKGTSEDVAADVRSIIAWLRTRKDVDGTRIMLAGHSEGGMVAPMVAVADPTLRGIALLAGSAYDGRKILMYQNKQVIDAANATQKQKDSVWARVPAQLDSLGKAIPWVGFFLAHDPIATAKQIKMPVLVLQGETDKQVSPEQAPLLVQAIKSNGNTKVELRTFPATNHLFVHDPSGAPAGYPELKDVKVNRAVLGALAEWAVRVSK